MGKLGESDAVEVDWWHRDHPTFSSVAGFMAGIATVLLVPALYVMVLRQFLEHDRVEQWFWGILLVLLVPGWLIVSGRSRRAGLYALLGMLVAVVVVISVGALVLWVLAR
jgi:hypothetical protein